MFLRRCTQVLGFLVHLQLFGILGFLRNCFFPVRHAPQFHVAGEVKHRVIETDTGPLDEEGQAWGSELLPLAWQYAPLNKSGDFESVTLWNRGQVQKVVLKSKAIQLTRGTFAIETCNVKRVRWFMQESFRRTKLLIPLVEYKRKRCFFHTLFLHENTSLFLVAAISPTVHRYASYDLRVYSGTDNLSRVQALLSIPEAVSEMEGIKHNLASFCGCNVERRLPNFVVEASDSKFFSALHVYTHFDLESKFRERHDSFISNAVRGCGYWIYKAQLSLEVLERMQDTDVLFFADCGCKFAANNTASVHIYRDLVLKCYFSDFGMLSFQTKLVEQAWTKMDTLSALDASIGVRRSGQLLGGLWCSRKTADNVRLLKAWLFWMLSDDHHFVDDSPSRRRNHPTFVEHRHDQSIFSILRKQRGSILVNYDSYIGPHSPIIPKLCKDEFC